MKTMTKIVSAAAAMGALALGTMAATPASAAFEAVIYRADHGNASAYSVGISQPGLVAGNVYYNVFGGGLDVTSASGATFRAVSTMVCNDSSPTQGNQIYGTNTSNDLFFVCNFGVPVRGVYGGLFR